MASPVLPNLWCAELIEDKCSLTLADGLGKDGWEVEFKADKLCRGTRYILFCVFSVTFPEDTQRWREREGGEEIFMTG